MQLHGFLSEKMSQKRERKERKERVTPGWTDISGPGSVSFLSVSIMHTRLTPHNPTNNSNTKSIYFPSHLSRGNK